MDENNSGNYAIIEKFNDRYIVLFTGSYDDALNCLPIYEELTSGVSEVKMVNTSQLNTSAIQIGSRDYDNDLDNLFLNS